MACNELRIANKHAAHAEHLVRFVDAYFHNDKICIAMEFADAVHASPELATARARCVRSTVAPRTGSQQRSRYVGPAEGSRATRPGRPEAGEPSERYAGRPRPTASR